MRTRVAGAESASSSPTLKERRSLPSSKRKTARANGTSSRFSLAHSNDIFCEQTSGMVWMFTPDGQCTYLNDAWLAFRGRKLEAELGFGWMEGIHPEDLNQWMSSFRIALENHQPFHFDCRVRGENGTYVSMVGHGAPKYLLNGTLAWYAGSIAVKEQEALTGLASRRSPSSGSVRELLCRTARDLKRSSPLVLVRKKGKRRKPKAQISVRALLECLKLSATPLVVLDKSGRAVYCNNSFRTFCAKALHLPPREAPHPARQAQQKRPGCAAEVGAWLDSDLSMLPPGLQIAGHQLTREADLTAFSIIDTSHEERSHLLEKAFLHDLINTAGSLPMLVDLLSESASHEERSDYVNLLKVSVERLLSNLDHEKMMLDIPSAVSSVCQAGDVLRNLQRYYSNHPLGRHCRIDIAETAPETVVEDQQLVVRVLDNVLKNTIEAAGKGGIITLGCQRVDSEIEFWIHNEAVTVEDMRTRLFKRPFFPKGENRGVGAQTIRLLTELYGRTVSVYSEPDGRTTVSVRCPAPDGAARPANQTTEPLIRTSRALQRTFFSMHRSGPTAS